MPRNFKVTVDVDELFELAYTKQVQMDDQREGTYWTTESHSKTFLSQEAALAFIRNERVTPVEFVRVTKLPLPGTSKPTQSRPTTL